MHPHWPVLAIGIIVGFYWARVLKMVLKQRRQTGRDANFVPREPLGRVIRIVWYPLVIVWIILPFVGAFWLNPIFPMRPLYSVIWLPWLAAVVALGALLATLVCWKKMGKSWRMGIDPSETTQLIFTGPYEYVRHPIYALQSLLMLATVVALPTPVMIGVALVHLLFLQWEARREEQYLVNLHGAPYHAYRARVGRFLPRIPSSKA